MIQLQSETIDPLPMPTPTIVTAPETSAAEPIADSQVTPMQSSLRQVLSSPHARCANTSSAAMFAPSSASG